MRSHREWEILVETLCYGRRKELDDLGLYELTSWFKFFQTRNVQLPKCGFINSTAFLGAQPFLYP